jgi:hypothetical protein
MKIQIAMDNHLEGHEEFAAQVIAVVNGALSRFGDHITWVKVHLSDENSDKGSNDDNRLREEILR